MSEASHEPEADQPEDPAEFPGLDPDQFVGTPPAGEADPGGFVSNDQSADPTEAPASGGEDNEEDQ